MSETISNCCSAAKKNEYCLCPECHEHCEWLKECPDCDDGQEMGVCSTCGGAGEGGYDGTKCLHCNGSGEQMYECEKCKGEGWVKI